jgi:hypothetical protein
MNALAPIMPPVGDYTLNITVSPSGAGSTNPAPMSYTVGQDPLGFTVTRIENNTNYHFNHWELDGVNVSSASSYTVLPKTPGTLHDLVVIFTQIAPPKHNLTVNSTPISGIQVIIEYDGTYTTPVTRSLNEGLQLVTVPDSVTVGGVVYNFLHWQDGSTDTETHSVNLLQDTVLTATYQAVVTWQLVLSSSTGGSTTPSGTQIYNDGALASVQANANSGYSFSYWLLDGVNVGATNPYGLTMHANHTLQAIFAPITYALTILATTGGTTSPAGTQTYNVGTNVPVTATPNLGYTFSRWLLDGVAHTENPIYVLMNANHTLEAQFTYIPVPILTLVANPIGTGSFLLDVQPPYTVGQTVHVMVEPVSGYKLGSWLRDGVPYDAMDNPVAITMDQNRTLTANFTLITIVLTVVAGANGSVDKPGEHLLHVGDPFEVTATPNTGYHLDHWDLGGENKGSDLKVKLNITEIMDGKTLTAFFMQNPPPPINITIAVSGSGQTDISTGSHVYHEGDSIDIAATPNAGATFARWTINGTIYTSNPLHLPVTSNMDGMTLVAVFEGVSPPKIPLWIIGLAFVIPATVLIAYNTKGGR